MNNLDKLKQAIRDVPNFPKQGVMFKDITPLLKDYALLDSCIKLMAEKFRNAGITKVAGIEARGFLFAPMVALELKAGVVPVRKKGKLPYKTVSQEYALEYGTDILEMHEDAVEKGDKVLLVDDVLATGGTAKAVCDLVEKQGGAVAGAVFLIELSALSGREKIKNIKTETLLKY